MNFESYSHLIDTDSHDQRSRFVILFHQFPLDHDRQDHWDLMLEKEGQLVTWMLMDPPRSGSKIRATLLPDHRIDYLSYEGPISGGRGDVTRVIQGVYEPISSQNDHWIFWLKPDKQCWDVRLKNGWFTFKSCSREP
ncbi:MAG: DNA polymerase ligase N-terminal domain-containing protein [Planctomycetota bacterium]